MYLPSDPRLEWPGEGPLFELNLNKCQHQDVGTIRVTLSHYLCQAWGPWPIRHQCKSLKIMYPLTSKKVEGSLSKHLCM